MLTVYRIDEAQRWDRELMEMIPLEQREVWTSDECHCQVYLPDACLAMVELRDMA